jgi:chromosome segregation ATPase
MHNDIRITNLANATAKNILNNINIKDIEGIDILLKNNTNTKDLQEFNRLNQEYEHIKQNIKINNEKKQKFDELESLEKLEEDNKMVKSDISKLESDIISKEKELKKILEEIKELENLEYQNSISSLVNFQHEKLDPFHSPHLFGINLNPFDAFTTISCSENYKYANLIDNAIKEINKIGSQDSVWRLIEANSETVSFR